jgi:hypothetical protein
MSLLARVSESVDAVAQHVHDLHNEISKQTQVISAQYRIEVDLCKYIFFLIMVI